MDLTAEQLNWMLDHYYTPVKVWDYKDFPSVCIQLASDGLVKIEPFGSVLQDDPEQPGMLIIPELFVVSPTPKGHEVAAHQAPATVLRAWGDRLSDTFLEKHVLAWVSLSDLPELLVCSNPKWRAMAKEAATRLMRE